MFKIEKTENDVFVHLPIETLIFDKHQFDLISENIFLISIQNTTLGKIVREKGNIEDLNMSHWLCLKNRYQTNFNDVTFKSLDVDYLKSELII